jgi:hypothetical protein
MTFAKNKFPGSFRLSSLSRRTAADWQQRKDNRKEPCSKARSFAPLVFFGFPALPNLSAGAL